MMDINGSIAADVEHWASKRWASEAREGGRSTRTRRGKRRAEEIRHKRTVERTWIA